MNNHEGNTNLLDSTDSPIQRHANVFPIFYLQFFSSLSPVNIALQTFFLPASTVIWLGYKQSLTSLGYPLLDKFGADQLLSGKGKLGVGFDFDIVLNYMAGLWVHNISVIQFFVLKCLR